MSAARNPKEVFVERFPRHAFSTDDLRYGLRMRPGTEALQKALVQFNPKHSLSWLPYDIDSDTAILDWDDRDAPPPNIIAMNPANGHAHYLYGLETPVHAYHTASQRAQRYHAAVDVALTAKLGADPGYSKLIGKNPVHARWQVFTPRLELYDLTELADWLDLTVYGDRRRRLPTHGLGRNCTLFENLRHWAYRARRHRWLNEGMFAEAVLAHAHKLNQEFTPPLPFSEVRATAKSVSRWTWQRMSPLGFSRIQQIRGKRGGKRSALVRGEQAAELRRAILAAIQENPDLCREDIAALFGVNRKTVYRHTRGMGHEPLSDRCPDPAPGSRAASPSPPPDTKNPSVCAEENRA